MATTTPNLGLVKPELQDNFNLKLHFNDNFDTIDRNFGALPPYELCGKSLYSDGDSIAQGSVTDNTSYAHLIADKYNMNLTSAAKGGTTLAVRKERSDSIYERVRDLMTGEYDYILLDGGTNDVSNYIELGTITSGFDDDFDEYTTLGALESICKLLTTNHFSAKKLFIFVNRRIDMHSKTEATFKAMKTVLEKWGIPYVDIAKANNLGRLNEAVTGEYFVDNIHPNLKAYTEFYLPYIEKALLYGGYVNSPTTKEETGMGVFSASRTDWVNSASYEYQRIGDWVTAYIYVNFKAFTPESAQSSLTLAPLPFTYGDSATIRETCITTSKKQMIWAIVSNTNTLTLLFFDTTAFVENEKLSFCIRYKVK